MTKFSALRQMREQRAQEADLPSPAPDAVPTSGPAPRRVGRPPGKRSNPDYQQVTLLLPSQTYRIVKKRLLDEDKEVSELVRELLDGWLKE